MGALPIRRFPSFLDALKLPNQSAADQQPLRVIVSDVLRCAPQSLVLNAKVSSGHIEVGEKLWLMPEATPVTVKGGNWGGGGSERERRPRNLAISIEGASSEEGTPTKKPMNEKVGIVHPSTTTFIPFRRFSSLAIRSLCLSSVFSSPIPFSLATSFAGAERFHFIVSFPFTISFQELLIPSQHFSAKIVTFDIRMPILKVGVGGDFDTIVTHLAICGQFFLGGGGESLRQFFSSVLYFLNY